MRRKSHKRQPDNRGGRLVVAPRTRISPDMELVWYQDEIGTGWRSRRAEVRIHGTERVAGHVDVTERGYRIYPCGLSVAEVNQLTRALAGMHLEEAS